MSLKKILPAVVLTMVPGFALATMLYGQAGDIAAGSPYYLSKGDVASYYKDGKEGFVTFSCTLKGEGHLVGSVYPGKNFVGNKPHPLKNGFNGPFTWKLRNLGESNGNIKVKLIVGNFAEVQCQG